MDEIIVRVVSNLQKHIAISETFLRDLDSLLDFTLKTNDPIDLEIFYNELSARNLSLSSLTSAISSAMDSGLSSSVSILASKVYLSILLAPDSPVFTLFTPMAFLSLLRAIRLAIKNPSLVSNEGSVSRSPDRKKKGRMNIAGNKKNVENRDFTENVVAEGAFDVRDLFLLLEKLVMVMDLVHLDRFPDCLKALVQTVCEIPMKAVEHWGNLGSLKRLCELCSEVLSEALKAKSRALAVESIIEIVKVLDFEHRARFADYVVKMSHGKGQFRLLSVDLIPILMMSVKDPFEFDTVNSVENSWGLRLLEALIERCSDLTAGIRARALTNLAQVVVSLSGNDTSRTLLKEVMGFGHEGVNGINKILKLRCMDEEAAVRKAALGLISKLIALLVGEVDEELVKTVGMACSDPLVSIRKVAISALSEAFRTYSNRLVTNEWMHYIPRLIGDNETSIQEECENLFLELVLDRISRAGSSLNMDISELLYPEGVLCLLKEICDAEVSPWVREICSSLGKKKKLQTKIATSLQNIIKKSESQWLKNSMSIEKWTAPPGAWFLLSEVSAFISKSVDWEFLQHHLQLVDKYKPVGEVESPCEWAYGDDDEMADAESNSVDWVRDRVFLLQTISNVSMELPPVPAADLGINFLKRLERFNMHSAEVNAHVKALGTLCERKAQNQAEVDGLVRRWVDQLQSKASQVLNSYISKISDANKENVFLTPPTTTVNRKAPKTADSELLAKAVIAVYTIGLLVIVCPSADLEAIVPSIHTVITSRNSDSIKNIALSLYMQAWLTMGKICLADRKLAKHYLPLFMDELETSDCAALRNNIVVMMADICVHYTDIFSDRKKKLFSQVDCYMSRITKCLRDPCELVRRQTFILLSQLLQSYYVKWREVLFLRFLLCLVDDSDKIRQLADFLFGNILKAKAPLLAYNSFVESIFVLNDCNAHTGRNNSNGSCNENRLFSIRGNDEKSRSQRMHIYATLLKQMAAEHLVATFAKVCVEILAAASDGMLSLEDTTGQSVLQDAFDILSSKEIRIQSGHASSSEPPDIEDEGADNSAGPSSSATRGWAITQAVRKRLIQNAISIFIELKRLLESKNSPLIGPLMDCLRVLLKDYKNEIDDILVADRQLQKELVYDIQKYEFARAMNAAESMQRSEGYRSPRVAKGKLPEKVTGDCQVASAVADVAAEATARSVLREGVDAARGDERA